ncbi:MAG: N-carbamoylsarcosine amidohydrolase [Ktedonobacteraceae bacterium]
MTDFGGTQRLYLQRGFSQRIGFGRRPALLVVDMIQAFTDPSSPLGSDLDTVVAALQQLLTAARARQTPIIFTTVAYDESALQPAHVFMTKVPALKVLKADTDAVKVDARLYRQPTEPVLCKQFASAFFGTALSSLLTAQGCDTLIVTGCTTSGCVRASVVDALQYGFRPIVPIEAVGDRASEPHEANLFDMQAKYADVLTLREVLDYLQGMQGNISS